MMNVNRQIQVKSFIETKLTLMKLIYLRIVSIQSAGTSTYLNVLYYHLYIQLQYSTLNICSCKSNHVF